jgi:protein O-mannosyl-transferase
MEADRPEGSDAARGASAAAAPRPWPRAWPLLAFGALFALGLALYWRALSAPFVSDDIGYLVSHPYTAPLSWANLRAILDPTGPAKLYTANYAPVHLLLTALERSMFADALVGYHLVNVALHALAAVLLVAWLRRSDVAGGVALAGGVLFAVHPANVEVVAWASQLKTCASLVFALGALLAWRRAPACSTALFALSLLTKASGLFALPTAAALSWCARGGRRDAAWLGVWALVAALYAIPQYAAFSHLGGVEVAAFRDPLVHLRTIAAVGMRYLVMAASGYGVSAFQEPEPARSWLDPWWLAALPAGALLAWRCLAMLRARRVESAFWVAAAASFAPVSQIFPFLNPVADRYLYCILPGLIGGVALAAAPVWRSPRRRRAAALGAGALGVAFALQSAARAPLWRSETLLLLDAAKHYPEGGTAYFLRARGAAQQGDVEGAVAALRTASQRGVDSFLALASDPGLAPLRDAPAFQALLRDLAGRWIERSRARGDSTEPELRMLALAHVAREEWGEAERAYEAALRAGGPLDGVVRRELAELREQHGASPTGGEGDRAPRP